MISSLRKLARPWAVVFILANLLNVLAPTISWALTSGPTAPEATSFEPVDTTDMVNLATGDFTYNIPLLEVPGPAGGYPLSLSYHAGIQPNEDASWVGLGWTLNPGAISRLTNGLPDDFNGAKTASRVYWQGGTIDTQTYGISVGIANVATVSAGLSFSQDTYRGNGVGWHLGAGVGYRFKIGGGLGGEIGANAEVGVSPYGETYSNSSVGIALSIGATVGSISANASLGLSVNSSGNVNAGLSGGVGLSSKNTGGVGGKNHFGGSLLGASINTGGGGGKLSAAGFTSSANNSRDGKISTSGDDLQLDIPIWYGINIHLGRTHIRYWMDETVNLENYGSVYFPYDTQLDLKSIVFDSYHVQGNESMKTGNNPEKNLEGSYADYDQYSVNAQGLAGNIRPHHYTLSLYSQDIVKESDGTKEILGYNIPQHSVGVQYRFVNDFSNKVTNDPPEIEVNKVITQTYYKTPTNDPGASEWKSRLEDIYPLDPVTTTTTIPLFFPYGNPETGQEGDNSNLNLKRRIPNVPGSKHVEYFANQDIINTPASLRSRGFIDCNANGFVRSDTDGKVGAFTITNQSGVNYHFSLPAYAYNEYTYSGKTDDKNRLSFNLVSQSGKYAYTWYLSGMTGPDYVDRGPSGVGDGILNDYDWGYWVDFQYGKWTDDYAWRNPSEGFNQDIDHRFQSFSSGNKEVYYLNAIRTKTHTAFFVKEIRADGRSVLSQSPVDPVAPTIDNVSKGTFYPWSRASLRLNSILLFDNKDLSLTNYNSLSDQYSHAFTTTIPSNDPETPDVTINNLIHFGQNVLDKFDAASLSFPGDKAIRVIDFNSDYSLTQGTSNSFDPNGDLFNQTPDTNLINTKFGKLTLKSLTFRGKGGTDNLPPTKFSYDIENHQNLPGLIRSIDGANKIATIAFNTNSAAFEIGDIVMFTQSGSTFYGYVRNTSSGSIDIKFLSTSTPIAGQIGGLSKTKNPPYNKDAYDVWGLYKSDYQDRIGFHLNRYTSELSARNTDAWSLRGIENSTGSKTKIDYEADTYNDIAFETASLRLTTETVYDTKHPNPYSECGGVESMVLVAFSNGAFDLTKRFKVGDYSQTVIQVSYEIQPKAQDNKPTIYKTECNTYSNKVLAVTRDKLSLFVCTRVSDRSSYDNSYTITPSLSDGKIYLPANNMVQGGGLRVKGLGLTNPSTGESRSTNYSYDFGGVSSGTTSYEPVPSLSDQSQTAESCYNDSYQTNLLKTLSLARDIPSPGVFYKKVKVSESVRRSDDIITSIPGYSEYQFETFNRDMIDYSNPLPKIISSSGSHRSQSYSHIGTRQVVLKDFTQRVGKLKSITLYDKDGRKVNETVHHYLHDQQSGQSFSENIAQYETLQTRFNKQGLVHETFNHARLVKGAGGVYQLQGLISKKENFPAIQTGTTTINFKTGIKTENRNLAFDFYNGNVTKSLEVDGYGNKYVTETEYAYHNYPAMGLKSFYLQNNSSNKHMLDQQSSSTTYKVNNVTDLSPIGLVSASAQTWSDQSVVMGVAGNNLAGKQEGIWRKKSSFNFIGVDQNVPLVANGDGLQPIANFTPFNAWGDNVIVTSGWQKNAEITQYDYNSHAIEATDINNHFAATKFSYDHSLVLATAANAEYKELAYSGAEELPRADGSYPTFKAFGGGVYIPDNVSISSVAHTGSSSIQANSAERGFTYYLVPKENTYQLSVWSSQANALVKYRLDNGAAQTATMLPTKAAEGWNQISALITVAGGHNRLEVWCEANGSTTHFDDFRFHPYKAAMASYVYNQWGELSHILDNNNLYTEYRYDGMGRLIETYKETFTNGRTKTTATRYHYANQ
jgi:hypothetical protein